MICIINFIYKQLAESYMQKNRAQSDNRTLFLPENYFLSGHHEIRIGCIYLKPPSLIELYLCPIYDIFFMYVPLKKIFKLNISLTFLLLFLNCFMKSADLIVKSAQCLKKAALLLREAANGLLQVNSFLIILLEF